MGMPLRPSYAFVPSSWLLGFVWTGLHADMSLIYLLLLTPSHTIIISFVLPLHIFFRTRLHRILSSSSLLYSGSSTFAHSSSAPSFSTIRLLLSVHIYSHCCLVCCRFNSHTLHPLIIHSRTYIHSHRFHASVRTYEYMYHIYLRLHRLAVEAF